MLTKIALAIVTLFTAAVLIGCELDATVTLDTPSTAQPGSTLPPIQGLPSSVKLDASITLESDSPPAQPEDAPSSPDTSKPQTARTENFRLLISDERNAIDDFAHLWVTIDRVGIHRGEGQESEGWHDLEIEDGHRKVDLVDLKGDTAEELIIARVLPGKYSKVFIHVDNVVGELLSGVSTPVKLPSERLQIIRPFEVQPDSVTTFVFDITVVPAGDADREARYILKPVIGESGSGQPFTAKTQKDEDEDVEHDEDHEHDTDDGHEVSGDSESADPLDEQLFLEIVSPEAETSFIESPATVISGMTRVDAVVSVNDDMVDVDETGKFEALVELEEGPNIIEVIASVTEGEEEFAILTVFYLPEARE